MEVFPAASCIHRTNTFGTADGSGSSYHTSQLGASIAEPQPLADQHELQIHWTMCSVFSLFFTFRVHYWYKHVSVCESQL